MARTRKNEVGSIAYYALVKKKQEEMMRKPKEQEEAEQKVEDVEDDEWEEEETEQVIDVDDDDEVFHVKAVVAKSQGREQLKIQQVMGPPAPVKTRLPSNPIPKLSNGDTIKRLEEAEIGRKSIVLKSNGRLPMATNTLKNGVPVVTKSNKRSKSVYFVEEAAANRFISKSFSMTAAFDALKRFGFEPKWVKEPECKRLLVDLNSTQGAVQLPPGLGAVFVMESFSGTLYETIKGKADCRIFGPICILQCNAKERDQFPKRAHPLLSLCMRNLIITCSNLTEEQKSVVRKRVELMGGIYCREYRRGVTHLISETIVSSKSSMARKLKVPIVSPDWIETCWEKASMEPFEAISLMLKFRLPLFKGAHICVSQFSVEERIKLEKVVTKAGGRYNGNLKKDEATHLVLKNAQPNNQKYITARKWKVRVVRYEWIQASIDAGYALPETDFQFHEDEVISSSTASSQGSQESNVPATFDSGSSGKTMSLKSPPLQKQHLQPIEEGFTQIQPATQKRLRTQPATLNMQETKQPRESSTKTTPTTATGPASDLCDDLYELSTQPAKADNHLFEGLDFHFIGYDSEQYENMKRVALKHGAFVTVSKLKDDVTHAFVGPIVGRTELQKTFKQVRALDCSCKFLTMNWLINSVQSNRLLDVNDYKYEGLSEFAEEQEKKPAKKEESPMLGAFRITKKLNPTKEKPPLDVSVSALRSVPRSQDVISDKDLLLEYSQKVTHNEQLIKIQIEPVPSPLPSPDMLSEFDNFKIPQTFNVVSTQCPAAAPPSFAEEFTSPSSAIVSPIAGEKDDHKISINFASFGLTQEAPVGWDHTDDGFGPEGGLIFDPRTVSQNKNVDKAADKAVVEIKAVNKKVAARSGPSRVATPTVAVISSDPIVATKTSTSSTSTAKSRSNPQTKQRPTEFPRKRKTETAVRGNVIKRSK